MSESALRVGQPTAENAGRAVPLGPLASFVRGRMVDGSKAPICEVAQFAHVSQWTWYEWNRVGLVPLGSARDVVDYFGEYMELVWPDLFDQDEAVADLTAQEPTPSERSLGRRAKCGTDSGYYRHRNADEDPCDPCKAAHATAERKRNGAAA